MARRNSSKNKNRNSRPASRKGMSDDYAVPMDSGFKGALDSFFDAAREQLGGSFSIYSGSRSPNKQTSLQKKYGNSRPVGSRYGSHHVTGWAADLQWNGRPIREAPKRVRDWMKAHAPKFGLSFPIRTEPWHIEPVGRVPAKAAGLLARQSLPETMPAPPSRPVSLPGFNELPTRGLEPSSPRFGAAPGMSMAGTEQSFDRPAGLNPSRMGGIGAIGNSYAGLETDRPVADPGGRFGVPGNSFAGLETDRGPTPGMSMAGTERSPGGLNPSRFGGSPGGLLDQHQDRYDRMNAPTDIGSGGLVTAGQGGPSPSRFGDSVFGDADVFDDSGYKAAEDFGTAYGRQAAAQSPFSTGTITDVVSPSAAAPRTAGVPGSSFAGQETAPPTQMAAAAPLDTSAFRQTSAPTPAQEALQDLAYGEENLPAEVRTVGAPPSPSLQPTQTVQKPSLLETPSDFPPAPPAPVETVSTLEPRPNDFATPPAPPKQSKFAPATKVGMRVGSMVGGPLGMVAGGLLGSQFGKMMRELPSYRDQIRPDQFSVGSGLGGIMAAQGGQRGATGYSRSNPGMSVTSLGNGDTMRRSDRYGWTEIVGPDGSVKGIQYDNPSTKGLLGRISDSIFSSGGSRRGDRSGMSQGLSDAIDRGDVMGV